MTLGLEYYQGQYNRLLDQNQELKNVIQELNNKVAELNNLIDKEAVKTIEGLKNQAALERGTLIQLVDFLESHLGCHLDPQVHKRITEILIADIYEIFYGKDDDD